MVQLPRGAIGHMHQPVEHPFQQVLVLFNLWIALFGLVNFLWKGLLLQQSTYVAMVHLGLALFGL